MAMTLMMRFGAATVFIAGTFSAASARNLPAQSAAQGSSNCKSNEFWYGEKSCCLPQGGPASPPSPPKDTQCPSGGWYWGGEQGCCVPRDQTLSTSPAPQCPIDWEWDNAGHSCKKTLKSDTPAPSQPDSSSKHSQSDSSSKHSQSDSSSKPSQSGGSSSCKSNEFWYSEKSCCLPHGGPPSPPSPPNDKQCPSNGWYWGGQQGCCVPRDENASSSPTPQCSTDWEWDNASHSCKKSPKSGTPALSQADTSPKSSQHDSSSNHSQADSSATSSQPGGSSRCKSSEFLYTEKNCCLPRGGPTSPPSPPSDKQCPSNGWYWGGQQGCCVPRDENALSSPTPQCPADWEWNNADHSCKKTLKSDTPSPSLPDSSPKPSGPDESSSCQGNDFWYAEKNCCLPHGGPPSPPSPPEDKECPSNGWYWGGQQGCCVPRDETLSSSPPPQCPTDWEWDSADHSCRKILKSDTPAAGPPPSPSEASPKPSGLDESGSCQSNEFWYGEKNCCLPRGGPSSPPSPPSDKECPSNGWYWGEVQGCCVPRDEALSSSPTPQCPTDSEWDNADHSCKKVLKIDTPAPSPAPGPAPGPALSDDLPKPDESSSCQSNEFWYGEKNCCLPRGGPSSPPSPPEDKQCPPSGWYWHKEQGCCVPRDETLSSSPPPQCPTDWEWSNTDNSCQRSLKSEAPAVSQPDRSPVPSGPVESSSCQSNEFWYAEKNCCLPRGGPSSPPSPDDKQCPSGGWYWGEEQGCCVPRDENLASSQPPQCPTDWEWNNADHSCKETLKTDTSAPSHSETSDTSPTSSNNESSSCQSNEFWYGEKNCCLPRGGLPSPPSPPKDTQCPSGGWYWGEEQGCCLPPDQSLASSPPPRCSSDWEWDADNHACKKRQSSSPKSSPITPSPSRTFSSCNDDEFWYEERNCCLPHGGPPSALPPPNDSECPTDGWYWGEEQECCVPRQPQPSRFHNPRCPKDLKWDNADHACRKSDKPRPSPSLSLPKPSKAPCNPRNGHCHIGSNGRKGSHGNGHKDSNEYSGSNGYNNRNGHSGHGDGYRRQRSNVSRMANICPNGLDACPISALSADYECLDTSVELKSCGGCASVGQGQDCLSIKGAWNVGCEVGVCKVYTCTTGFTVSQDRKSCVTL